MFFVCLTQSKENNINQKARKDMSKELKELREKLVNLTKKYDLKSPLSTDTLTVAFLTDKIGELEETLEEVTSGVRSQAEFPALVESLSLPETEEEGLQSNIDEVTAIFCREHVPPAIKEQVDLLLQQARAIYDGVKNKIIATCTPETPQCLPSSK